jgi:hypothetical protein
LQGDAQVKVNAIGGGAEEIMKDLASRQMGWCAAVARPTDHVEAGGASLIG